MIGDWFSLLFECIQLYLPVRIIHIGHFNRSILVNNDFDDDDFPIGARHIKYFFSVKSFFLMYFQQKIKLCLACV